MLAIFLVSILQRSEITMLIFRSSQLDTSAEKRRARAAKGKVTGLFATRAEYKPNPIAVTTCEILKIEERKGTVTVKNIDTFDGTPIVDLKPTSQFVIE